MFISFTEKLKNQLTLPLPGEIAQFKMSASLRVDNQKTPFSRYEPNAQTRDAGVLILLYAHEDTIFMPLIVRPSTELGAHSGQVSFPGGKKENTDKNLRETALREAYEEVGIKETEITVLGEISPLFVFASNFMVYPTVAVCNFKPNFVPDTREVAKILEVPLLHLQNTDNHKITDLEIRNTTIIAPYFDVEGHIVWGATAMILNELLEILEY